MQLINPLDQLRVILLRHKAGNKLSRLALPAHHFVDAAENLAQDLSCKGACFTVKGAVLHCTLYQPRPWSDDTYI